MTNINVKNNEHDQVQELLPWWVNNTIDSDNRDLVFKHINTCRLCQDDVLVLRELYNSVRACGNQSYTQNGNAKGNFTELMQKIDRSYGFGNRFFNGSTLFTSVFCKVLTFVTPGSGFRWGATCATGVLLAIFVSQIWMNQPDHQYFVLSSGIPEPTMRLSVYFTAGTTPATANEIILQHSDMLDQKVVVSRDSTRQYLISFREEVGVSALNELFVDLKQNLAVEKIEIFH